MLSLPIPPGRYAVTRRRSPAPGCEGDRVYAEAQPVTLHALVSDGRYVMALVEHVDGHFETVREVDLQRVEKYEGAMALGEPAVQMAAGQRRFDIGPGFVRARSCPDCGHTRCGEDCTCNCDAAHAEHEAGVLREMLRRETVQP